MTKIKIRQGLTQEEMDQAAAEIAKLSSLIKVKEKLEEEGKPTSALPEEKIQGARARDNDVYMKDFVEGAYELAVMLGIEDRGTTNPSKGLSFKAKNYQYYDFMEYWTALVKRFKENEDTRIQLEKRLSEIEILSWSQEDVVEATHESLSEIERKSSSHEEIIGEMTKGIDSFADILSTMSDAYFTLLADTKTQKQIIEKLEKANRIKIWITFGLIANLAIIYSILFSILH
jgi:hypothetical protein